MLRSRREFAALQEGAAHRSHPLLAVRMRPTSLGIERFGISTGRRVGPAVVRNRVRRRIREILRTRPPAGVGRDVLVVARPASASASYAELRSALLRLLATSTKEGITTS